jgi:hypothetical protein
MVNIIWSAKDATTDSSSSQFKPPACSPDEFNYNAIHLSEVLEVIS